MSKLNNIISKNITKFINEATWNFHVGKEHDSKPYGSESKFVCYHETGQFGSGTYFSTYNGSYERRDFAKENGVYSNDNTPTFIQIKNGLYRVDIDLYKNLYRVHTEKQGDVLHTMMGDLNKFYHKISGFGLGHYNRNGADFDNSLLYQRISVNAKVLGLECPKYYRLIRMAQELAENESDRRSFSTAFMEFNGFNGVNVSGVDKFDNSRHGSVIYDLSKVSDNLVLLKDHPLNPNVEGSSHTNSIGYNFGEFNSLPYISSLAGKWTTLFMSDYDEKTKLRIVKNLAKQGKLPSGGEFLYYFKDNEKIINYVLRLSLYNNDNEDFIGESRVMDYIVEHNMFQFVNYEFKSWEHKGTSFLIWFLDSFKYGDYFNDKTQEQLKEYLDNLMGYLKRDLTQKEINYIKEDYYGED